MCLDIGSNIPDASLRLREIKIISTSDELFNDDRISVMHHAGIQTSDPRVGHLASRVQPGAKS